MSQQQNQSKPFTGNFQLQTKIRVIIQQVLAATIRKLSVFNEKIDKFQDYFMIYKQKVQGLQKSSNQNKQSINVQYDERLKMKKQMANQVIKGQQQQEKNNIRIDEIQNQINELTKTIKAIQRQNENLNSQLSKTKTKFLQYSNVISGLKQEVSWKITKYIEQTAQTNTQIKINNQQMKKQYFNVMLMLQKQKQKYDKIIELNQNHQNNTKRLSNDVGRLQEYNKQRIQQNKRTLQKLDQYDTILQSKLKTLDSKCELRISSLQKDNQKSMNAVKKLQTVNSLIQQIKQQVQKNNHQLTKKIQDINKKTKDQNQIQIVKLSKQLLRIQKGLQKKLVQIKQTQQKSQDFFTQKIDFIKMELQSQLSSHTNQLKKQKQNSNQINSSTMDQINNKFNKFNIQIKKELYQLDNNIKQVKSEMKKQLSFSIQNMQNKIQNMQAKPRKMSDDDGKKLSPQMIKQIQQFSHKITKIQQRLKHTDQQIQAINQNQGKMQIYKKQLTKKIDSYFKQQQQDITNKVQKIMFLVTKMRGDNIVRNQFIQKEIKQIKKNHSQYKLYTDTILKLMPAFGQCINLIMSLIYDAEYQHSKIIQDNLPTLKKDQEKFSTCLEGILYEFKQKKKPGIICYRHKDIKKTDLVKATFNAYIKIWQQLFENEFKNKQQYLPKGFYKKAVQKIMIPKGNDKRQRSISPNKESLKQRQVHKQRDLLKQRQNSFYEKMTNSAGFSKPYQYKQFRRSTQKDQHNMSQSVNSNISNTGIGSLNHIASRQAAKSLRKIQQQEMIRQIKDTINSKQQIKPQNSENNLNSSFHIRKKKTVKKDQVIVMNVTSIGE